MKRCIQCGNKAKYVFGMDIIGDNIIVKCTNCKNCGGYYHINGIIGRFRAKIDWNRKNRFEASFYQNTKSY